MVSLPAAELSLGFGPKLISTDNTTPATASSSPPEGTTPQERVDFLDAENDAVRLELHRDDEVIVLVNGQPLWRGTPAFNRSTGLLECGGQGSTLVPDGAKDSVEAMLRKVAEARATLGTVFSLRALPIGGYVRFDDRKTIRLEDGTMASQLDALPTLAQLWVYSGGVVTNAAVAFATLCLGALTTGVPEKQTLPGLQVVSLGEDDALRTGLAEKDVLLQIGELDLHRPGQSVKAAVDFIHALPAQVPVNVLVERAGTELRLDVVPLTDTTTGLQRLGVSIIGNTKTILIKANNFFEAAHLAAATMVKQLGEQLTALQGLVSSSAGSAELVGPVGIVQQGSDLAETDGVVGLATFFVSVNLNLALLNALPVPALDGGKIMFAVAGEILGAPVDEKRKQEVEAVFVALVAAGIASLTLKDVYRLFHS